MKIIPINDKTERLILIGLITNDIYFSTVFNILDLNYFSNKSVRELVKWCKDYYIKYNKAPKKDISIIFEDKVSLVDDDVLEYLENLLADLSDEYETIEEFNVDFYVDKTIEYFKKQKLQKIKDTLDDALENNNVDLAEKLVQKYTSIELTEEASVDPFNCDNDIVVKSLYALGEPLFSVPGALGRMLNNQFYRASFIALQGAEKVGKSWILQELMLYALKHKKRVVFFEAGDLTMEQRLCRLYSRLANKVWIPGRTEGEVTMEVPLIEGDEELDKYEMVTDKFEVLSEYTMLQAKEKWKKRVGNRCRLFFYSNSTLTVRHINEKLEELKEKESWIPDVIIIDYADILTSYEGNDDRTKTNNIWKGLRTLSQDWNCCLITATQADANSYDTTVQTLKNFSEDKRKYSHVTAMISLNRTSKERQKSVMRVAPLLIREGASFSSGQVAIVSHSGLVKPFYKIFDVKKAIN